MRQDQTSRQDHLIILPYQIKKDLIIYVMSARLFVDLSDVKRINYHPSNDSKIDNC